MGGRAGCRVTGKPVGLQAGQLSRCAGRKWGQLPSGQGLLLEARVRMLGDNDELEGGEVDAEKEEA